MRKLYYGERGCGKTTKLIEEACEVLKSGKLVNDELIFKKKFDEFKKEAESIMWTEDAVHDYCVGYSTSDVIIISLGCALIAFFAVTISLICYFCRRERKRDFMKVIDSKEDQTQP